MISTVRTTSAQNTRLHKLIASSIQEASTPPDQGLAAANQTLRHKDIRYDLD